MTSKSTHWTPPVEPTKQEQLLLKQFKRTMKLFRFLREERHLIFSAEIQEELLGMYRGQGGLPLVPPGMLAMATLLQSYTGVSDAGVVQRTVVDLGWQMVLGCLGSDSPAFSQGALYDFRHRLVSTNMDRRLLEHTREVARATGAFDSRKLPKRIEVAMDSAPLVGAGRVEDTFNLLGHAARNVVACAAGILEWRFEDVCVAAGVEVLLAPSVKSGLDCNWSKPEEKRRALKRLMKQLTSLDAWLTDVLPEEMGVPPLKDSVDILRQVIEQDLEPDPDGGHRIRDGVATDRRVSVKDGEMRHGRKSKSKRFNGFKRHIALDLGTGLVTACAVLPANRPEEEAAPRMQSDTERQGLTIAGLHIDRGYISSATVGDVLERRGEVYCKPWNPRNASPRKFTKADFKLDLVNLTIRCPAGEVETIRPGRVVEFSAEACDGCSLRGDCTMAAPGRGRTVSIGENEALQAKLRKLQATRRGRQQLRKRVAVEHSLAHITRRQGLRARYLGSRLNLFDLRRAAVIQNLETCHRLLERQEKAA